MPIKVTFEFETPEEAAAFILGDSAPGESGAAKPAKRGRPPKADAASAAAPAAQPAAAVSAAPAASVSAPTASPASPAAVPFKAVADVISELAEKDHPKAVGVLAQFGAKKASDLKPEQYAGVVEAARQALSGPTATSLI